MNKIIKIYGERNTNTNYLSNLIKLNLDCKEIPGVVPKSLRRLQRKMPGNEFLKDMYFILTYYKNLGWKHTRIKPAENLNKYKLANSDIGFITITKNPYSWLLSLYRRPYHYYSDLPDFETFLCRKWEPTGRDNINRTLSNPIELWNIKNKSYLQFNGKNILHLKSENIIIFPEKTIYQISSKLCIKRLSTFFINYEVSTKEKTKNYDYYHDYYVNERWKYELTSNAIATINKFVDKKLMTYFGYNLLS